MELVDRFRAPLLDALELRVDPWGEWDRGEPPLRQRVGPSPLAQQTTSAPLPADLRATSAEAPPLPDGLLSTAEAAALLGVQAPRVLKLIRAGRLPVAGQRKGPTGRPGYLVRRADVEVLRRGRGE